MKVGMVVGVLVASLGAYVVAADEQLTEDQAAKKADSRRLLEVRHARDRARAAVEAFVTAFRTLRPQAPDQLLKEVADAATDEAVDLLGSIQEQYLSDGEIKALIAFYETPLGQKLLELDAKIEAESKTLSVERKARLVERIKDRLLTSGHDPASLHAALSPVRVGGPIAEPKKLKNVTPDYPEDAKKAGVQGVVVLECTISPQGTVSAVKVLEGIPTLDEPAIAAVRQWVYAPTVLNGVPVPVIMTVTVNFRLATGRAPREQS